MVRRTRAEILAQRRVIAAKWRKKIQDDPVLRAEHNRKRREKYTAESKVRQKKKERRTERQIRKQRKYWRNYKRAEKGKRELQNSLNQTSSDSYQAILGRKKRAKYTAKTCYIIKTLRAKIEKLELKVNRYKVRIHRVKETVQKMKPLSNSPRTKLNAELKRNKLENVSPEIRRQLLYGCALQADLNETFSNLASSRKRKRKMLKVLSFKFLTKYRFLETAKPYFPVKVYEDHRYRRKAGTPRRVFLAVKASVRNFYEQDDVSIQKPGKRDYITRKKVQKQKRYLIHSLKYLHKKFCQESKFVLSYSTFCKLRPFWVINMHLSSRDTCLCVKCENMNLIHRALQKIKLFKNDLPTVMNSICCPFKTPQCLFRKCSLCKNEYIELDFNANHLSGKDPLDYYSWEKINEKDANGKVYSRVVKEKINSTVLEVCDRFFELQMEYMNHSGRILHQYRTLKGLKNDSMNDDDAIMIHCDFSENYSCKYFREIQSCHFGANRKQITLHTGIIYHGQEKKAFCTVSQDLRHDAVAVWSHLSPILSEYKNIKTVHFVSDSPSSQYRNKSMFKIILKKIIKSFPSIKTCTWNYLESGHGKSGADGVGGVVKRTCDRVVAASEDVANLPQFLACVQEHVRKVWFMMADDRDKNLEDDLKTAPPVQGTMSVHQVTWNADENSILYFNRLSCFECKSQCSHFFVAKKEYIDSTPNSEILEEVNVQNENDGALLATGVKTNLVENLPAKSVETELSASTLAECIDLNDWVVVVYPLDDHRAGFKQYIGQVIEKQGGKYRIDCLRMKGTREFNGFVYKIPDVRDDKTWVSRFQICKKIEAPQKYQRALRFNVRVPDFVKNL